ncbi:MAG: hypothetical protein JO166_08820, partial [Deltaproteobacteria bacterium]|nr:hypothetical protein [Deltaproteobacteria bacterium]
MTSSQLEIVVGVPGPAVGVGVAGVADAVAVAPGVPLEAEVGVAVTVGGAPSSRKSIDGLPHQWMSASAGAVGVVVGVDVFPVTLLLPPKGLEQDASSITSSGKSTASPALVGLPFSRAIERNMEVVL